MDVQVRYNRNMSASMTAAMVFTSTPDAFWGTMTVRVAETGELLKGTRYTTLADMTTTSTDGESVTRNWALQWSDEFGMDDGNLTKDKEALYTKQYG